MAEEISLSQVIRYRIVSSACAGVSFTGHSSCALDSFGLSLT